MTILLCALWQKWCIWEYESEFFLYWVLYCFLGRMKHFHFLSLLYFTWRWQQRGSFYQVFRIPGKLSFRIYSTTLVCFAPFYLFSHFLTPIKQLFRIWPLSFLPCLLILLSPSHFHWVIRDFSRPVFSSLIWYSSVPLLLFSLCFLFNFNSHIVTFHKLFLLLQHLY